MSLPELTPKAGMLSDFPLGLPVMGRNLRLFYMPPGAPRPPEAALNQQLAAAKKKKSRSWAPPKPAKGTSYQGRTASYPAAPSQIPACSIAALGSSIQDSIFRMSTSFRRTAASAAYLLLFYVR